MTRGRRRFASVVVIGLSFGAASALAAYSATRSDALSKAEALARRGGDPASLAHVVRLARAHLARQPWSTEAARLAATTLSRLDHPDAAEPYYRRLGQLTEADAHTRAYAILRSNDRDAAIAAYLAILARWPSDTKAQRLLGGVYFSRRQYNEALDVARSLQQHADGAAEGFRLEAAIQHELRDPEAAVAAYEHFLELNPSLDQLTDESRTGLWFRLCTDLLSIGRASEALNHLSGAVGSRTSGALLTLRGRAHLQLGQSEQAEACWRDAIALNPSLGAAWLELGRFQASEGQLPAAIESLETAHRLAPRDAEVLYALLQAHRRTGNSVREAEVARLLSERKGEQSARTGAMGSPVSE